MANICARVLSALYNYSMNCRLVFHVKRKMKTAAEYLVLAAGILVTNSLILEVFVQILHLSVYPAKVLTETILFFMSWTVQKKVIFKKRLCLESNQMYPEAAVSSPAAGKAGV